MLKMLSEQKTHERIHEWINGLRKMAGRTPRRYDSLEEAFQRMQEENPHLSADQARHLTIHGSNQNEDGTYSWKFDNYVRVVLSGQPVAAAEQRVVCAHHLPDAVDPRHRIMGIRPGERRPRETLQERARSEHRRRRTLGASRPTRRVPRRRAEISRGVNARIELVERLHASAAQRRVRGDRRRSPLLADLLTVPGASATVLEARVPYAGGALAEFVGGVPDQACSVQTACDMAMAAFQRAHTLAPGEPQPGSASDARRALRRSRQNAANTAPTSRCRRSRKPAPGPLRSSKERAQSARRRTPACGYRVDGIRRDLRAADRISRLDLRPDEEIDGDARRFSVRLGRLSCSATFRLRPCMR